MSGEHALMLIKASELPILMRRRKAAADLAVLLCLAAIPAHKEVALLWSEEHFSVDGTLVKAWAWGEVAACLIKLLGAA